MIQKNIELLEQELMARWRNVLTEDHLASVAKQVDPKLLPWIRNLYNEHIPDVRPDLDLERWTLDKFLAYIEDKAEQASWTQPYKIIFLLKKGQGIFLSIYTLGLGTSIRLIDSLVPNTQSQISLSDLDEFKDWDGVILAGKNISVDLHQKRYGREEAAKQAKQEKKFASVTKTLPPVSQEEENRISSVPLKLKQLYWRALDLNAEKIYNNLRIYLRRKKMTAELEKIDAEIEAIRNRNKPKQTPINFSNFFNQPLTDRLTDA